MCDPDVEAARVWNVRRVRARKPHQCEACGLPIAAGIEYDRIGCYHEGWSTYRVHTECHAIAKRIGLEVCSEGVYHVSGLREQIREHYGEEPRLLHDWRRVLRARIAEGVWP